MKRGHTYILFFLLIVSVCFSCNQGIVRDRMSYEDLSVYVAMELPYIPRSYIFIDKVGHGFIKTYPLMGGGYVSYVVGKWQKNDDTIIAIPSISFSPFDLKKPQDSVCEYYPEGKRIIFIERNDTLFEGDSNLDDYDDDTIYIKTPRSVRNDYFPYKLMFGTTLHSKKNTK